MLLDGRLTLRETEHEVLRTTMAAVGNLARHVIRRQSCTADLTEVPGRRQSSTDWDRAAHALLTKSVSNAMLRLSNGERAVLIARFYLDQGIVEIDAGRGVKPQTVKELERRALRKLGEALRMYRPTE